MANWSIPVGLAIATVLYGRRRWLVLLSLTIVTWLFVIWDALRTFYVV
jgi:hypothetical protein